MRQKYQTMKQLLVRMGGIGKLPSPLKLKGFSDQFLIVLLICRDYGATRGFSNESEFTVVKVDFYNDIKKYLAELDNTDIRSLEDIVKCVKCLLKHKKRSYVFSPSLARVLADINFFLFSFFSAGTIMITRAQKAGLQAFTLRSHQARTFS